MQTLPNAMSPALLHSAFCLLHFRRCRRTLVCVLAIALIVASIPAAAAASDYYGQVIVGRVAVPGATVTATQGDQQRTTSTDTQGIFRFADIADGTWTITIELRGFAPLAREVTIGPDGQPAMWELALLPFEEIARSLPPPLPRTASLPEPSAPGTITRPQAGATNGTPQTGFQRAGVPTPRAPAR
jgi:hypothetical protein